MTEVKDIQHAIAKHGLPLTVRLKRNVKGTYAMTHPEGEWHTVQAMDEICLLYYTTPNNKVASMNMKSIHAVHYLQFTDDKTLDTFDDIFNTHRKFCRRNSFGWYVCTEANTCGLSMPAGQIFKIIRFSRMRCCCCKCFGTNVKVQLFPSGEKHWLPCSLHGAFRKCNSPLVTESQDILTLLETNPLPLFIKLRNDDNKYTYVTKFIRDKILITCTTNEHSKPAVQVFPVVDTNLITVSSTHHIIGVLDQKDLVRIRTNDQIKQGYEHHICLSYNELGIQEENTREVKPHQHPKFEKENVYDTMQGEEYQTITFSKDKNNKPPSSVPVGNGKSEEKPLVPRRTYQVNPEEEASRNILLSECDQHAGFDCTIDSDDEDPYEEYVKEETTNDDEDQSVEEAIRFAPHSFQSVNPTNSDDDEDDDEYQNTTIIQMKDLPTKQTNAEKANLDSSSRQPKEHTNNLTVKADTTNLHNSSKQPKESISVTVTSTKNRDKTSNYSDIALYADNDYQQLIPKLPEPLQKYREDYFYQNSQGMISSVNNAYECE